MCSIRTHLDLSARIHLPWGYPEAHAAETQWGSPEVHPEVMCLSIVIMRLVFTDYKDLRTFSSVRSVMYLKAFVFRPSCSHRSLVNKAALW
jgi:hypothetical protein